MVQIYKELSRHLRQVIPFPYRQPFIVIKSTADQSTCSKATMQLRSLLTAMTVLAVGITPVLALPGAIPELFDRAPQCIAGGKQAGSHCEAGNLGAQACSNDNTAKVSATTRGIDPNPRLVNADSTWFIRWCARARIRHGTL